MNRKIFASWLCICIFLLVPVTLFPQNSSHPHLFFDKAGMDALRDRVSADPVLEKMWRKFKRDRVDKAMKMNVVSPFDQDTGREYGDALADLSIAWIVTRDIRYVNHAKKMALDLADAPNWSEQLAIAHISIGYAFCWDFMYDRLSSSEQSKIKSAAKSKSANYINPNQLSNHNWTPSAAEGLLALAFRNEINFRSLLKRVKDNFKEAPRSVLWAHGADGFSPQGLGYWRKYNQVALFFKALRHAEPANDWFRLGKEYPGSEFLEKTVYPRIYTDVQHPDMSCISWGDSRQIGRDSKGPYACMGMFAMAAFEYGDGYARDFLNTLVNEPRYRFEDEDAAAFIFYDNDGVPSQSYRDLPLSAYWPNMEAAVFRSGWDKEDMVFFMRCGSQGGHAAKIKGLPRDGHSHPDANGFVLYYNNDYLAAEDGAKPDFGPHKRLRITYGHNTLLVDGNGQRGDLGTRIPSTSANMDFLDTDHVGYLLGNATDAYDNLDQFYRYVIYKKHKYFVILDEVKDDASHKYEFLLGTDKHHVIRDSGNGTFDILPRQGAAKLPVVFVEPRNPVAEISTNRPYAFGDVLVDLLRAAPPAKSQDAAFFALLYPQEKGQPDPVYRRIYDGRLSGIVVDDDEYFLYNVTGSQFIYRKAATDAKLSYHKDDPASFEYLAAGGRKFVYEGKLGFEANEPLVVSFRNRLGKIRVGKTLGTNREASITLYYPGVTGILVDGQPQVLSGQSDGHVSFRLRPKQYQTGPSGYEQTVTENYAVEIQTGAQDPFVKIIRPNGGESWLAGTTKSIRWRSLGNVPQVGLEYTADSGGSWKRITDATPNNGIYDWNIPFDLSDRCLVRITALPAGGPSDVSDSLFAIVATPDSNRAPVANDDHVTTRSGSALEIDVLSNDTDTDGFIVVGSLQIEVQPMHGAVVVNPDSGFLRYSPEAGFAGIDSLQYSVMDNNAAISNTATVFITTIDTTTTLSFFPLEDAFVKLTNRGGNYGVRPSAKVQKDKFSSYFKFRIEGLNGPVQQARLRLFVTGGSISGGSIHQVANDFAGKSQPWDEMTLNAANAPGISGLPLSALGAITDRTYVEFDVTGAIEGNGIVSFGIRSDATEEAKYSTKEDARPPELLVEFVGGTGHAEQPDHEAGSMTAVTAVEQAIEVAGDPVLSPGYPNPFNAETTISYRLPREISVRLSVYNLRGQRIRSLFRGLQAAGLQKSIWNGRNDHGVVVGTGLYFIELIADDIRLVTKLILQK